MEKIIYYIEDAEKRVRKSDHILYITFPLIKDKKLLLKVLLELKVAILDCINAILQMEYISKRINLSQDPKTNLRIFQLECAPNFNINEEEIRRIKDLITLAEKHKKSHFEFVKDDKIVILSENFQQDSISFEEIKDFLLLSKSILKKTSIGLKKGFLRKL